MVFDPDAPSSEPVRVWIVYDPAQRADVMEALNADHAVLHHSFPELDAVAVTLPSVAIDALEEHPGVKLVELDQLRFPLAQTVPYGVDAVQARDVWDRNRDGTVDTGAPTGAGIGVCVIDSGIYTAHQDFQGLHIIGGEPSGWDTDRCGHGTHVSGTLAAANNNVGVVGVTPGAINLYMVKVFGDDCTWVYSSDLAFAANRCAAQPGVRIISMSLGGGRSNTEQRAFDNLYAAGILSVAAAGNDGTTAQSYPASYSSVISVAAVDSNNVVASFSQHNSQVELAAPGVGVLSTVPYLDQSSLSVSGTAYQANHIENAARGSASGTLANGGLCDSVGSWNGRVVLCERGAISFYDKVHNVQLGGGSAAVIYNNAAGNFIGTLGDGFSSTIIGLSLSQADGQFLVANRIGQTGNVSSTFTVPASGYEAWDGTSMATPHVSAVAALVWSAAPGLSNADIRSALDSSAHDLGSNGRDSYYGFGLVQAAAAIGIVGGGGCSSNADCADGDLCNGSETCAGGACQPGTPVSCAPGQTCNPANGTCSGGTCAPRGGTCSSNADCCSNRCRFHRGSGSCR